MPQIGETVVCAETNKPFVVTRDGCSLNYATSHSDEILSDEGVDIRQKRDLLDRSKPFTCYLSSDTKNITGWKGNKLGVVVWASTVKLTRWSHWHGSTMSAVRVKDIHGGMWYGRGSDGMAINLRPMK